MSFGDRVLQTFEVAARTYEERNRVYKDNFRVVGRLMNAMFPNGAPKMSNEEDFNRWHIFELIIVKLTRYVQNWNQGGHKDSLDDILVYVAMLQEIDSEWRDRNMVHVGPEASLDYNGPAVVAQSNWGNEDGSEQ